MQLLKEYFRLQEEIYKYFGYVEDWRVIPLDDCTEYFWRLTADGDGRLCFAESEQELQTETGQYYEDEIYMQRFLPKWVYRGEEYTMVCCDPHTDGNKFLRVLDNKKERPETTPTG